jgi:hypothetical protein
MHDSDFDADDASPLTTWQDGGEGAKWTGLFRATFATCDATGPASPPHQPASPYTTAQRSELPARLAFYAGVPVVSKFGHAIGIVFVVCHATHAELAPAASQYLAGAAQKCMRLLDYARERVAQDIWARINRALDQFVESRAVMAQILEEPRTTPAKYAPGSDDSAEPMRIDLQEVSAEPFVRQGSPPLQGTESKRLLQGTSASPLLPQSTHMSSSRDRSRPAHCAPRRLRRCPVTQARRGRRGRARRQLER